MPDVRAATLGLHDMRDLGFSAPRAARTALYLRNDLLVRSPLVTAELAMFAQDVAVLHEPAVSVAARAVGVAAPGDRRDRVAQGLAHELERHLGEQGAQGFVGE